MRLRKELRNRKIDVVVACSFKSYMCAKAAVAGLPCGVVFWVHGVQKTIAGRVRSALFARMARHDTLLFVSEAVRRAKLPFNHAGPSAVVYNGVSHFTADPSQAPYPRSRRADFGIRDDAFVIGYVAEMVPWKDHVTLIAAFEKLTRGPDAIQNARLVLVGTGTLEWELKARIEASPARDRIHLLGARTDARALLGLMDVCAHPAREEGFGLAVVEAMLAQKPVVVAGNGALIEYVKNCETGAVFEPGNVDELATKLRWVHAHPTEAAAMALEGCRRCLSQFSTERYANELANVVHASAAAVRSGQPRYRSNPGDRETSVLYSRARA
jgi:glycosyltransferase involved in cell wall biosynthesis